MVALPEARSGPDVDAAHFSSRRGRNAKSVRRISTANQYNDLI
jgi:hypothetical protein